MTNEDLVFALPRFIMEVHKKSGENYLAETLYDIIIYLKLFLAMKGRNVKILDEHHFYVIRNTLDNRMKELTRLGCIKPHKKARIITIEEENLLWQMGILGNHNPKVLIESLFVFGIHFVLHAGMEHHAFRFGDRSQLKLHIEDSGTLRYLEYTEDCSKHNPGGIGHMKLAKKVVRAYENTTDLTRCIVKFYEQYISACPKLAKCPDDFYLRSLAAPKSDVWYSCQPMGRLKLSTIVGDMAKEAGLKGRITNHSLRATSASRLYHSNCDEQIVKEHTGHRSDSVCEYKCTSDEQMYCASASDANLACLDEKPCKIPKVDVECKENVKGSGVNVPAPGDKPMSLNFTFNFNC